MKKYFNPTIETVEIEAKWMLCNQEGSNPDVSNGNADPWGAPGRVF